MALAYTNPRRALLHPWRAFGRLVAEPARVGYESRHLVEVLVWRDFTSRYRGSAAGVGWAVLLPLALVAIYTIVFSQLIQNTDALYGSPSGFALFLLSGNIVWVTANEVVMRSTTLIQEHSDLIHRSRFPVEVLPLIVVLTGTIGHLFGLLTFAVTAVILKGGTLSPWVLILPAVVGIQGLVLWCLTCLFTPLSVYFRDFRLAITPIMLIWFFLTPIFYPIDRLPPLVRSIVAANPFTVVVSAYRSILLAGAPPDAAQLSVLAILAWVGVAVGLHLFRRVQSGFVEEL